MDKTVQDLLNKLVNSAAAEARMSGPEKAIRESLKNDNVPEPIIKQIVEIVPEIMADFIKNPTKRFSVTEDICGVEETAIQDKLVPHVQAVRENRMWYRVHIEINIANLDGDVGTAAVAISAEEMLSGVKEIHFSDMARKHLIKQIGNEHYVTDDMVISLVNAEWEKYNSFKKAAEGLASLLHKLISG